MHLGRKQAYWAVCIMSVIALAVIFFVSGADCSILEGVLASIVAAGIFALVLEILPYACRAEARQKAAAMVYRNLELFLTRVDDFFLYPCWEATDKKKSYDEWVADCGMKTDEVFCREFYGQWMKNFHVTQASPYHGMSCWEFFRDDWNDAKDFYRQCMACISLTEELDLDLVYEMQHIIHESMIGVAFRIVERNDSAQERLLGLFAFCGENQMEQDIFQPMKELHRIADRMYESLKDKKWLATKLYPPRLYQGDK